MLEVDTVLDSSEPGERVKRGRVVVKEIGPRTRKGGYHLTLMRYKQFEIIKRNLTSWTLPSFYVKR